MSPRKFELKRMGTNTGPTRPKNKIFPEERVMSESDCDSMYEPKNAREKI